MNEIYLDEIPTYYDLCDIIDYLKNEFCLDVELVISAGEIYLKIKPLVEIVKEVI